MVEKKEKRKAPFNTSVLESWVGAYSRETGIAPKRLNRWIHFMVLLAALEPLRDDHGRSLFVLKGGVAMELRLGLEARATNDLDTVFRQSMDGMLGRLDEALRDGYGDFTFERSEAELIGETGSQRTDVKLSYRGRRWGTVHFEIAPAEGKSLEDVDNVDAIGIDSFGIEGPKEVPCLTIRYQLAQKLHACTEPPPDGKNENHRFHDLIDLLLLEGLIPVGGFPPVRVACVDTFSVRARQAWPPDLVVYPSWFEAYERLAVEQGFAITDVEEAAMRVRGLIATIDEAT
jgi:Nucleotidyl transferase AbiEii toxin, Type IV TA system